MMNTTQKVGGFWDNVQNNEDRQFCRTCNCTESMEHILITCQEPARQVIWQLARRYWPHEDPQWPDINIGIIQGCGVDLTSRDDDNRPPDAENHRRTGNKGKKRLMQILISESAHQIWAIRCERVIQGGEIGENEAKARWLKAINKRLIEDKIIATTIKRTGPATQYLRDTWEKTLEIDGDLPY